MMKLAVESYAGDVWGSVCTLETLITLPPVAEAQLQLLSPCSIAGWWSSGCHDFSRCSSDELGVEERVARRQLASEEETQTSSADILVSEGSPASFPVLGRRKKQKKN